MSVVRLFSGEAFISAEFTDISFEVKAELYFDFLHSEMFSEEYEMFSKIELRTTVLSLRDLFQRIKTPSGRKMFLPSEKLRECGNDHRLNHLQYDSSGIILLNGRGTLPFQPLKIKCWGK